MPGMMVRGVSLFQEVLVIVKCLLNGLSGGKSLFFVLKDKKRPNILQSQATVLIHHPRWRLYLLVPPATIEPPLPGGAEAFSKNIQ